MRKIVISIILLLVALISVYYRDDAYNRHHAQFGLSFLAPSGEYRIDKYYMSSGEPMILLLRVYDKDQHLIAEYVRDAWPGAATSFWTCEAQRCTEYTYETGDDGFITLPPDWFARMRAKLP